jgi:hypothetical protein
MAKLTFTGDTSSMQDFFHGLQEEVIRVVNDPARMFRSFKGTIHVKMDAMRPRAEYISDPSEELDEGVLKSHIFLLNYTMITYTLKHQQMV